MSFLPSIRLTWICRYSEIRTMQVNHLLNIWLSGSEKHSKAVREGLEQKIDDYAAGELDHAVDAMSSIWEISNEEGTIPFATAPPSGGPKGFLWGFPDFFELPGCKIQHLLIKSIKEGYFLDRKYWARRSREGGIEPVYFSVAVVRMESLCLGSSELLHAGGY